MVTQYGPRKPLERPNETLVKSKSVNDARLKSPLRWTLPRNLHDSILHSEKSHPSKVESLNSHPEKVEV